MSVWIRLLERFHFRPTVREAVAITRCPFTADNQLAYLADLGASSSTGIKYCVALCVRLISGVIRPLRCAIVRLNAVALSHRRVHAKTPVPP